MIYEIILEIKVKNQDHEELVREIELLHTFPFENYDSFNISKGDAVRFAEIVKFIEDKIKKRVNNLSSGKQYK